MAGSLPAERMLSLGQDCDGGRARVRVPPAETDALGSRDAQREVGLDAVGLHERPHTYAAFLAPRLRRYGYFWPKARRAPRPVTISLRGE